MTNRRVYNNAGRSILRDTVAARVGIINGYQFHPSGTNGADPSNPLTFKIKFNADYDSDTLTKVAGSAFTGLTDGQGFGVVLNIDDDWKNAHVIDHNQTTGVITLDRPLNEYFAELGGGTVRGALYFRHASNTGFHLTAAGSRAYADMIFNFPLAATVVGRPFVLANDFAPCLKGSVTSQSPVFLHGIGGQSDAGVTLNSARNIINGTTYIHCAAAVVVNMVTTSAAGRGLGNTYLLDKRPVIVKFVLGAGSYTTSDEMSVVIKETNSGSVIYSASSYTKATLHCVPIAGVDSIDIEITQVNAGSINMIVTDFGIYHMDSPVSGKVIDPSKNYLFMGDSWFDPDSTLVQYRWSPFRAQMARLMARSGNGAGKIAVRALSDMTMKYVSYWIAHELDAADYDAVFINAWLNDFVYISGSGGHGNFTDPDGNTIAADVDGATDSDQNDSYLAYRAKVISECLKRGVSVYFLSSPVGSSNTCQLPLDWRTPYTATVKQQHLPETHCREMYHLCSDNELADATAWVNVFGKYTGRIVTDADNSITYMATGRDPTDTWEPIYTGGVEITPA